MKISPVALLNSNSVMAALKQTAVLSAMRKRGGAPASPAGAKWLARRDALSDPSHDHQADLVIGTV